MTFRNNNKNFWSHIKCSIKTKQYLYKLLKHKDLLQMTLPSQESIRHNPSAHKDTMSS